MVGAGSLGDGRPGRNVGSSLAAVRRYEGGSIILGGVYELTTVVTPVA